MIKINIIVDDVGTLIDTEVVAKPTHIPLEIEVIEQKLPEENEL